MSDALAAIVVWDISNPIRPTYSFWAFKPFYGDQKQAKQVNADQCRPGQTKADHVVLVVEVVLVLVVVLVVVLVLVLGIGKS